MVVEGRKNPWGLYPGRCWDRAGLPPDNSLIITNPQVPLQSTVLALRLSRETDGIRLFSPTNLKEIRVNLSGPWGLAVFSERGGLSDPRGPHGTVRASPESGRG